MVESGLEVGAYVDLSSKDRNAKLLVSQTLKSHDYGFSHSTTEFALDLDNLSYGGKATTHFVRWCSAGLPPLAPQPWAPQDTLNPRGVLPYLPTEHVHFI